jgi:hypothetical protein
MPEYDWVTTTPEQIARSNELSDKWRAEAEPFVVSAAALTVLLNILYHDIPADHREATIEQIYAAMRQTLR